MCCESVQQRGSPKGHWKGVKTGLHCPASPKCCSGSLAVVRQSSKPTSWWSACFRMELCHTSLWKYLKKKKDKGEAVLFSVHSKLEILRDVAAGMIYLHSEQIVHGDLIAVNILLNIKGTEVVAMCIRLCCGFGGCPFFLLLLKVSPGHPSAFDLQSWFMLPGHLHPIHTLYCIYLTLNLQPSPSTSSQFGFCLPASYAHSIHQQPNNDHNPHIAMYLCFSASVSQGIMFILCSNAW